MISGLVSGYALLTGSSVGILGPSVLSHPWDILFFPFRIDAGGSIFGGRWGALLLSLYVYWFLGAILEQELGRVRYNLYMFSGMILATIAGVLVPGVTALYIYYSVFFAVAYIAPDMELYVFFVLPVKIKWLAWIAIAIIVMEAIATAAIEGSGWAVVGPLVSFLNFLVFFGREHLRRRPGTRTRISRSAGPAQAIHRCTVCGVTELDDPEIEFRFCVQCADHEYCMNHLHSHEHIG